MQQFGVPFLTSGPVQPQFAEGQTLARVQKARNRREWKAEGVQLGIAALPTILPILSFSANRIAGRFFRLTESFAIIASYQYLSRVYQISLLHR